MFKYLLLFHFHNFGNDHVFNFHISRYNQVKLYKIKELWIDYFKILYSTENHIYKWTILIVWDDWFILLYITITMS